MRLELTVDIPESISPEVFAGSLQDWLAYHHLAGVQLLRWRVIEDPDPNEEHSTKGSSDG